MKKLIDIPEEMITDLKISAMAGKPVKIFIQNLIIKDVKENAKKLRK